MNLYALKTGLRRWLGGNLGFFRPSIYPFISSDSFKALSQHALDELTDIDPANIMNEDLVFVRGNHLAEFQEKVLPLIRARFILISHGDDSSIQSKHLGMAEDKRVMHWFAENLTVSHAKITPVPIGLNSFFYEPQREVIRQSRSFRGVSGDGRKNRIFYGFNTMTNRKVREPILAKLQQSQLADGPMGRVSKTEYIRQSSEYKFVASPPGNGPDCHRTWEALLLKSVPIVERTPATEHWRSIGIPLLLIDSWSEIDGWSEEFLEKKYAELSPLLDAAAIYMPYWIEMINQHRMMA